MLAGLACLLVAASATQSTPPRPIHQLVHSRWVAEDGAPSTIRALAQTADGYLWLGTTSGVVRFDGMRFVPVQPTAGDKLPTEPVRDLFAARDGTLWILWSQGSLSHLVGGRLKNYGLLDGLAKVYQLAQSSRGLLVAGTSTGVSVFSGGEWTNDESALPGPRGMAAAVWFDQRDALWVVTKDRVIYRPEGERTFVDPGIPLISAPYHVEFAEEADGTVWMAELSRSAHTLPRLGEHQATTEVLVGTWTLLVDRRGSLWIGSAGDGLRRVLHPRQIRGTKIAQFGLEAEQFTEKDGLLSDVVWDVLEDREGNIWVATDRGLERFREGTLVPFATQGGVRPRSIFASLDSSIWATPYAIQRTTKIGPRGERTFLTTHCYCTDLAEDPSGVIWSFTDRTVVRFDGREFTEVPLKGPELGGIKDIVADLSGTIWIADVRIGLARIRGALIDTVPGLNGLRPTSLFSDRSGRIWIGTANRIAVYSNKKLAVFEGVKEGTAINSFYQDRRGTVWIAKGDRLEQFEEGRVNPRSVHQGLRGLQVYAITEDRAGDWWMASGRGLLRVDRDELYRAVSDTGYVLKYRAFDRLDGLPGAVAFPDISTRVLAQGEDGRIWIAGDSGVAAIDPQNVPRAGIAPRVLIEAVRIDSRELLPSDAVTVPAKTSDLEIDYTATRLAIPERVQFRYRLEGEDRGWRDVGARRRAYYTGLGPGRYRFRVMASDGDGIWNGAESTWSFRVLPAWYQTRWFQAAMVLLIAGFGVAGTVLVQRGRQRRAAETLRRQFDATLAERSRIAQDLHDTLLQGFAGVTMQLKAAELAMPERPDAALETLQRIQRVARQSLREARERVWDMREQELDAADLLAALEQFARERTLGMPIEVVVASSGKPRRFPPAVENAAFRIGREAVTNAVKHAEPRRLEINVEFAPSVLRVEVSDDGKGFTPSAASDASRKGHLGLSGIRDRVAHAGGRCEIIARDGGGTIVAVELPLAKQ
jgi:signal transduction histidine kinase/ligand-binding sensor domain-containing protein